METIRIVRNHQMSVVAQAETRKTERNRDISVDIYWRMVRSKKERRGVNLRIKKKTRKEPEIWNTE